MRTPKIQPGHTLTTMNTIFKSLLILCLIAGIVSVSSAQSQLGDNINGEHADDQSGKAISLSDDGSIIAIGAYYNSDSGTNAGHVRVYHYVSGVWTQMGKDIDGEAEKDYSGISVSLSSNGNIVAIGAYFNDANGAVNAGQVRVYEFSSGTWSQLGEDIDGESADDNSGRSVSISADGSVVAIGATGNKDNGKLAGQVRVFEYNSGSWTQRGGDINGDTIGDYSGFSISLSADGNIVAIGSSRNDDNGIDAGKVKVFEYSSGSWNQVGDDILGEAANNYSGISVSISDDGSIVAIGASANSGTDFGAGHVRVYKYSSGAWTQLGDDIDGDAGDDRSGSSVALSADGDVVAIGAPGNDGSASDAGQVKVFRYENQSWTQVGADIEGEAADDQSGFAVALSADGGTVAVGSPFNDGSGEDAGTVKVFDVPGVGSVRNIAGNIRYVVWSPNPAIDIVVLKDVSFDVDLQVSIYDMMGRKVVLPSQPRRVGVGSLEMDISCLAKGTYTIEVVSSGTVQIGKILKQ